MTKPSWSLSPQRLLTYICSIREAPGSTPPAGLCVRVLTTSGQESPGQHLTIRIPENPEWVECNWCSAPRLRNVGKWKWPLRIKRRGRVSQCPGGFPTPAAGGSSSRRLYAGPGHRGCEATPQTLSCGMLATMLELCSSKGFISTTGVKRTSESGWFCVLQGVRGRRQRFFFFFFLLLP